MGSKHKQDKGEGYLGIGELISGGVAFLAEPRMPSRYEAAQVAASALREGGAVPASGNVTRPQAIGGVMTSRRQPDGAGVLI